jgi:type II secretory pathway pseudopilin PulG
MSRLPPTRQQGFGLLVFVIIVSVMSLSLILGYSGLMTRQQANQRNQKLQSYLRDSQQQIESYYAAHAGELDSTVTPVVLDFATLLQLSNVQPRWGLQGAVSSVLGGTEYSRKVVLYFPTDTDGTNPPNLQAFRDTGVFTSCQDMGSECAARISLTLDSSRFHKEAAIETQRRLERVALKAQTYFKARLLLDPERNVSTNYFHPPYGNCQAAARDIPCLAGFVPLVTRVGSAWVSNTPAGIVLGLAPNEMVSGWGAPIEAANDAANAEVMNPPYTMVFRTTDPFGNVHSVTAVESF